MAIAGLRGTGDWGTDERPKNFREMILWLNPNGSAPLTALMSKMATATTNDPEFAWWEETLSIVRLQANDATPIDDTVTTITINNGLNGSTAQDLKAGDLLLVETTEDTGYTAEILQVASVTSATVFEAVRGAANTTAAAIPDDTWLTKIGSAYEEGSAKPTATTRNPTKFLNYTQIFKDLYSITGTARATHARTGDPVKNDKKRKVFDHSTGIEQAALFGKAYEDTGTGGKPLRYAGGLMNFLATAVRVDVATAMVGATGINDLMDVLVDVFDYSGSGMTGGDERIGLCGNGALNAINKAAQAAGTVQFGEVIRVYGMN
ncbi:MAG: hypothetical protein E4H01_13555, partial [Lysobacterales bacterium]